MDRGATVPLCPRRPARPGPAPLHYNKGRRMDMRKRLLRSVLAAAAAVAVSATAGFAQMDRLEMVAPGGPGSGQDQVARAVAQALQKEGIVRNPRVVNIAGGGGMVAFAQFISSKEGDANAVLTQG